MKRSIVALPSETRAALRAFNRAARKARELAKATGSPFYVVRGGRIVDLNASRKRRRKARTSSKMK